MNQQQIDKIRETTKTYGIIHTLTLLGDNIEIIRQSYINEPESYLDYLIGNLRITKSDNGTTTWTYNFKRDIFYCYDDNDEVYVYDFIWNYFYRGIMQFDDHKIESLITQWFYKHIPPLSERKPIVHSDIGRLYRYLYGNIKHKVY